MIDIHTHSAGREGLLSLEPVDLLSLPHPEGAALYSVGFHPWNLPAGGPSDEDWEIFLRESGRRDVAAIGECGLDLLKGPVMAVQMNVFARQAQRASELGKPVLIHCVKAWQQIIGLKKELNPVTPWAIHGFRGKPGVARMLAGAGFWVSFGEKFNPDSLHEIPADRLLCETDESGMPIEEIARRISGSLGMTPEEGVRLLEENASRFLGL